MAIPTWVNAGEPISQLASHIAKYFSNSIREDGMLAVATAGIVFAPGARAPCRDLPGRRPQRVPHLRPQPDGVPRYAALLRGDRPVPGAATPGGAARCRLRGPAELSIGDEPEQIVERFPTVSTPPSLDRIAPEMLVRRMRNVH